MVKKKLKLKKKVINHITIISLIPIMLILFFASFYIYNTTYNIKYYKQEKKEYSYILISKMSTTFAEFDNKELHFALDKDNIYVVATKKNDKKYQEIIDYTYGKKVDKTSIKTYVYPVKSSKKIKSLALKNIDKFLQSNTKKDYDHAFANYYLDTTVKSYHKFNYIVSFLLLLNLLIIGIIIRLFIVSKKM